MNKLIFPPALKYLPVWSLGEAMLPYFLLKGCPTEPCHAK